jgi:hypothetical protein
MLKYTIVINFTYDYEKRKKFFNQPKTSYTVKLERATENFFTS